jgi:hypothetical protein
MGAAGGGHGGARPAGFDDHRDALADEAELWDDPPEHDPGEPYACAAYLDSATGQLLYCEAGLGPGE